MKRYLLPVTAMTLIVLASNIFVQFPILLQVGQLQLADILTYGALTYPLAFLVTDLTNRMHGAEVARRTVYAGFAMAVLASLVVPPLLHAAGLLSFDTAADRLARIAMASGLAFLIAQLLDVAIFDRLRRAAWWRAPISSSVTGSVVDTGLFFALAFAPIFLFMGPNEPFALETAPLFGVMASEAPRWVSWALGDLGVKLTLAILALVPYRIAIEKVLPAADGPRTQGIR